NCRRVSISPVRRDYTEFPSKFLWQTSYCEGAAFGIYWPHLIAGLSCRWPGGRANWLHQLKGGIPHDSEAYRQGWGFLLLLYPAADNSLLGANRHRKNPRHGERR